MQFVLLTWRKGEGIAGESKGRARPQAIKAWDLNFVVLECGWGGGLVKEWEGKSERVEGEMKGISKEVESVSGTNKLGIS